MVDTTAQIRAAVQGQAPAVAALVERFGPWLLFQARHRLRGALQTVCDPADLVHDVWVAVLPRLPRLELAAARSPRAVMLAYLGRALVRRLRDLCRHRLRTRRVLGSTASELTQLARTISDAVERLHLQERRALLHAALARLSPEDQQIIVLRGIEQHAYAHLAALLGCTENTAMARYRRACSRLRDELGATPIADLADS
jgi:RNA polymerase sigma factor (sigma-70 family)